MGQMMIYGDLMGFYEILWTSTNITMESHIFS